MKVKLLMRQKGNGEAGEIVEVSPERAAFLFSVEAAEPVNAREQAEEPEATAEKPAARKPAATKPAATETAKKAPAAKTAKTSSKTKK